MTKAEAGSIYRVLSPIITLVILIGGFVVSVQLNKAAIETLADGFDDFKDEVRHDVGELRGEIQRDVGELREEIRSDREHDERVISELRDANTATRELVVEKAARSEAMDESQSGSIKEIKEDVRTIDERMRRYERHMPPPWVEGQP